MKFKTIICVLILTYCYQIVNGQILQDDSKRDFIWKMGFGQWAGYPGGSYIDFNQVPPTNGSTYLEFNLGIENSSICDINGDLLFSCNGTAVLDVNGLVMPNGDSINFGQAYLNYHQHEGYPIFQGVIVLPKPTYSNIYYIFHILVSATNPSALGLYYSIVDMSLNNGLGEVILKNQPLITDTIQFGFLTACRHGNGRDWWILIPSYGEAAFHRILIDPEGIHNDGIQCIGNPYLSEFTRSGKAIFSPDGLFYAKGYDVSNDNHEIELYSFDRCTGLLSDFRDLSFTTSDYLDISMSIEFSPNSKRLYSMQDYNVYQFDLTSLDIIASKQLVANWDGFHWMGTGTGFQQSQITPDSRIFIAAGSTPYLHVINNPDSLGVSCNLVQHSILLDTRIFSTPNFPNFRLENWVGSPCDLLVGVEHPDYKPVTLKCDPNPVMDNANFSLDLMNNNYSMKLEIYDLLSTKIGVVNISPFQSIINYNTTTLSTGIFIAVLKKEGTVLSKCKFIK